MKCPSVTELIESLERDSGEELIRIHSANCPTCAKQLSDLKAVRDAVFDIHDRLDRKHDTERCRLLAAVACETQEPSSVDVAPASRSLVKLTPKRLFGAGIVATASLALIAFAAIAFRPVSAFEKAITAVRDTPSYIVEVAVTKPSKKEQLKLYRLAGSFRMEAYEAGEIVQYTVTSRNKPGITVYTKEDAFIYRPPDRGEVPPLAMLEELANFKGNGRELGSKVIGGRQTAGFVVELNEIDPDVPGGELQMWVDSETSRPLEMTMDFGSTGSMRFFAFDWNAAPVAELFNTEPPKGYVDRTPEPTGNQELVAHAKRALQTYWELIGTYPKVKIPFADRMRDEMFEKIGDKRNDPRSDEYVQVHRAMTGFSHMMAVFRHNEDAVYYGRTVTATDGNKVLFRWKTEDGRYQVIYGDLTAELVSEARLRTIEGQ